jgi:hypothetical protein
MKRDWRRFSLAKFITWLDQFFAGSPTHAVLFIGGTVGEKTVPDNATDLSATVTFLDAEGSPTTADSTPVWSSSDEAVATLTAAEDGMSATVAVGSPGVALISVTTTNDDGSTATAEGTLTVQPGDAVIGSVEFADAAAAEAPPAE